MKPGNRNVDKAASRTDRSPAALQPAWFPIDERTQGELLSFAAKFAREITYYNELGKPDGDWAPFFENDPVVALFQVVAYPVAGARRRYAQQFRQLNHAGNLGPRADLLWEITQNALTALHDFEGFYRATEGLNSYRTFFTSIITLRLSQALQTVMLIEETLGTGARRFNYAMEFSDAWFAEKIDWPESSPARHEDRLRMLIYKADAQLHNVFDSLEALQREAKDYLEKYVLRSGNVSPHIGLLLAFFDLYKLAQDRINGITGRHLDHYYAEVLGIRRHPRVFGYTHVVFTLGDGAQPQELKPGTLLDAGAGKDGEPLLYALTHPMVITAATIERLIAVECNHAWPEKSLLFEKHGALRERYLAGPGALDEQPKDVITASRGFGFALCNEMLAQPEGDRKFSFILRFSGDSFNAFLASFREELKRRSEEDSQFAELGETQQITDLLQGSFAVSCSTEEGWYEASETKTDVIFFSAEDSRLQIDVLLETSEPGVTAVIDPTYPQAFAQQLPLFRFLLRREDSPLYRHLRQLVLESAMIDVEVIGIRQLAMRNDFGPVAPGSPFEIFGPQPVPGSAFYLGHPALLTPLYDLRVTIEWMGHSSHENGFAEYYRGYDFIKDNSSFKICASSLRLNRWIPTEDRPVFSMFQDVPEGMNAKPGAVSRITRLNNIDVQALELDKGAEHLPGPGPFPEAGDNGFLRFEFCFPPNGFGHAEYPALVNKATQAMTWRKKDGITLPAEPYIPIVKTVWLDFKSKRELDFTRSDNLFYQVYPYGQQRVTPGEGHARRMVPHFPDGSTLMIGLSGIGSRDSLALLSKLNDVVSSGMDTYPVMKWSLLQGDRWLRIEPSAILSDETGKMKRTGITSFAFGVLENNTGDLYDPSLLWMRLESVNGIPFTALLENLHTQAGTARLHSGEPITEELPAHAIKALFEPNAAIDLVEQPYASQGDRSAETPEDWRVRISERLRHRSRALSAWDYEHLVLQHFPEVQMVKCISHQNAEAALAPGEVLVAVLPATGGTGDLSRKGRFTQEKLDLIASSLRSAAPEGVAVNVVNPQYEKIKVKLRVKFRDGYDENFFTKRLNEDIVRFLDPWLEGGGLQVKFGAPASGFSILNFIERLPYVDFVTNFNVLHFVQGRLVNTLQVDSGALELVPTTPVSVLVSDTQHVIGLHSSASSDKGGINDMMIGTDFLLNADTESTAKEGINYGKIGRDFIISGAPDPKPKKKDHTFKLKLPT